MRTRHRGRFAFIIVAMLMAGGVIARDYDKQAAEAAGAQMDAVTVFVDADWGGREDGAAREITRAHKAFQMRGYRLLGSRNLYRERRSGRLFCELRSRRALSWFGD
jgi:hypothetical protein